MEQFEFTIKVTAADCNPQREMALDRLAELIIDVATNHANRLGIGFDCLIKTNLAWVLSRLALEMHQPMLAGESYRVVTWVESINRMFSERNFAFLREKDQTEIGYARTTWMALDMDSRRPGDLSMLKSLSEAVNTRVCPIEKCGKLLPLNGDDITSFTYHFSTSDIDINRHVATRRYIDLLIDAWSLDFWDYNRLSRLDMAFKHEAHYDQEGLVKKRCNDVEISVNGNLCTLARFTFEPRVK